ncbi:MAG: hypothetical protein EOM18_00690 [Clostridia bacterium]|nr:hypothetical protein [Clostridia bacterium]
MSTYLGTDPHANFKIFYKMLVEINFSDSDELYIIGDVLDRGEENLCLLNYVKSTPNIHLIMGNHELFALMYLRGELSGRRWDNMGGTCCRMELDELSEEKRVELREYLESLPYMMELKVKDETWILSHSGLNEEYCIRNEEGVVKVKESITYAMQKDSYAYLISNDLYYMSDDMKLDHYLVAGHYPYMLRHAEVGKIYKNEKFLGLDAGNGYRSDGGKLAVYRIEDGRVWYV